MDERVRRGMDVPTETRLFHCGSCGNVAVGQPEVRCCETPMRPVDDSDGAETGTVSEPTLDELLRTVFGMSDTELDVCLCVMESGELTVTELADRIDYDRSVVARHLNHLAELGVVEKRRRILEQGGHVYVYTPNDPDTVRRRLRELFLVWVRSATRQLDALRREKVEAIVESERPEAEWTVFHRE